MADLFYLKLCKKKATEAAYTSHNLGRRFGDCLIHMYNTIVMAFLYSKISKCYKNFTFVFINKPQIFVNAA